MSKEQPLYIVQPSNPIEVLALIDAASCERFANDTASLVREGHVDPIQVRVLMSAWEKAFKSLKSAIEPEVAREAEKHGRAFDFMGAKCEWVPVSTVYDYSRDVTWANFKAAVDAATAKQKEREAFLKTVKEPFQQLDPDTGELITVTPPIKTQTEGLKITIK